MPTQGNELRIEIRISVQAEIGNAQADDVPRRSSVPPQVFPSGHQDQTALEPKVSNASTLAVIPVQEDRVSMVERIDAGVFLDDSYVKARRARTSCRQSRA